MNQTTRLLLMPKLGLFVFLLLLGITESRGQITTSNYNPLKSVDSQLRAFFEPICRPTPGPDFLWDMSTHLLDSAEYTDNNPDTVDRDVWFKMYEEMRNCAYDTNQFITHDSVYRLDDQFKKDTVVMNMFAFTYLKFKDSALFDNTYFTVDTFTQTLTEIAPCELNPFNQFRMFSSCPEEIILPYKTVTYRIDKNFMFGDSYNDFVANNWMVDIDFGDGSGYHPFNPNITSHINITYPTAGVVHIKTRVRQFGIPIMSSNAMAMATSRVKRTPNSQLKIGGANLYVIDPCSESGGPLQKTVFYLEGFDPGDMFKGQNRDWSEIWDDMLIKPQINELINFGYRFVIVEWENSRRDIKDNGIDFAQVLNHYKCEMMTNQDTSTHQQFIVIGESMGGLVARYALTYLEQNWQTFGGCLRQKMHNTRLLITFDTPHKGANVPIAIQHLYRNINNLAMGGSLTQLVAGEINNALLDAQSAKQMLLYHVDTWNPISKNYSASAAKTAFDSDLAAQGNYPDYCKMVALSNGSLKGIGQTHFYDTIQRTPNDYLLDLNSIQWLKLFGETVQLLGTNFDLRTTPYGSGPIHSNLIDFYQPKVFFQIKAWKLRIKIESKYWFSVGGTIHGNNVQPYDVIPGSTQNANKQFASDAYYTPGSAFAHLLLGSKQSTYDPTTHTWSVSSWGGGKRFGFGRDVNLTTDGFHWCFVPTFSALDYSKSTYWENIEDDTITNIVTKTPFDVISGITENFPYERQTTHPGTGDASLFIAYNIYRYQREHLYVRNEGLGSWHDGLATTTQHRYLPCGDNLITRPVFWLNREIGDDTLLIENRETAWLCLYDAERYIGVNQRSRYYEYVGSITPLTFPGLYSKNDSLTVASGKLVIFMTLDSNNMSIPSQYNGRHRKGNIDWVKCCTAPSGSKNGVTNISMPFQAEQNQRMKVYPNPVTNSEITIEFSGVTDPNTEIGIYDVQGRKLLQQRFSINKDGESSINLKVVNGLFPSGTYIVVLKNAGKMFSERIVIK